MLIATHARSGGTKFGLDLADKHNLRFVGEVSGSHLKSIGTTSFKKEIHETNCQPVLSDIDIYKAIYSHEELVVLLNTGGYLHLDRVDYVLLRENPTACCLSFIDLLLRPHSGAKIHWQAVLLYMRLMFNDMFTLITCCVEHKEDLPIIWFEDIYPAHTQNLKYFNQLPEETSLGMIELVKYFVSNSDIETKISVLQERTSY